MVGQSTRSPGLAVAVRTGEVVADLRDLGPRYGYEDVQQRLDLLP